MSSSSLILVMLFTFPFLQIEALGPATVNLGTAANYVILAQTGITTTGSTAIVGSLGLTRRGYVLANVGSS